MLESTTVQQLERSLQRHHLRYDGIGQFYQSELRLFRVVFNIFQYLQHNFQTSFGLLCWHIASHQILNQQGMNIFAPQYHYEYYQYCQQLSGYIIIQSMSQNIDKKISEIIRSNKCQKNGCLSNKQDNLEVVWFGNKFDSKQITCSSCVLMNDLVVGRLQPVQMNVLPVSAFAQKFSLEYHEYLRLKNSNEWKPRISELDKQQIKKKMDTFQKNLHTSLKQLVEALQKFTIRVTQKSTIIFTVPQYEQIQKMNNEGDFSKLFIQVQKLIKRLHRIGEQTYRFVNQQTLKQQNQSLRKTISETISLVNKTLNDLFKQIQTKTNDIHKI